ncbi:MAG: hypothetical protein K2J39_01355 [Ruminococcus sp.]|nr:hypothetical protein [Ruminococcus sp.]
MIDEMYKLSVTLQVMKEQREKMVSDFTDNYDITMMEGLQRFDHNAEYDIYAELYHVLWIDKHWNHLQKIFENNMELEDDRKYIEKYFAKCFLKLVENFSMYNDSYTPAFYEILRVKEATLKDMINIAHKSEQRCKELSYAQTKHKKEYQAKLQEYLNRKSERK